MQQQKQQRCFRLSEENDFAVHGLTEHLTLSSLFIHVDPTEKRLNLVGMNSKSATLSIFTA